MSSALLLQGARSERRGQPQGSGNDVIDANVAAMRIEQAFGNGPVTGEIGLGGANQRIAGLPGLPWQGN